MTILLQIIFWLCVCAIGWPYLFYPLCLRFLPDGEIVFEEDASFEPTITILIAAYNEEAVIEDRIANLLLLDYPREKLECLIVSDGSSDRTNELVLACAEKGITLLAQSERSGKVNALNAAAQRARGEILVLSDANTDFAPDALRRLVAPFQNPSIGCVCGKLTFKVSDGSNSGEMEGAYWHLESRLKRYEGRRGALLGANGGIYALRRELWRVCPPGTIVEDFVIPMRLLQDGWKIFFEERAKAFEEAAMSCNDEFVRRVRIGAGDYQALVLLYPMLSPFRGFVAFAFFSRKVVRWLGPFFMLGALGTNALLLAIPLYRWLLVAQVAGYLASLVGIRRQRQQRQVPFPARIGGYFLLMNAALFCGFFQWLTGRHSVKWERTPRLSVPRAK